MDSNQPDDFEPEMTEADAYFWQGIDYGLADDYDNAIAALTKAIQLDSTKAKYYYRRAVRHFINGQWKEAIADYTEALRLKPNPKDDTNWNFTINEAYEGRASAYRYEGNYEAALVDFAELIRLQPDNPYHYSNRSVIYKLKGDYESAIADIHTLKRLNPDDSTYLSLMAHIELLRGDKTAAMAVYDEQVERFGIPASYFYRGQLWKELGNLTKAIADFEETIRLLPEDYPPYVTLGETYLANGDFTKAINILNALMERSPGFQYAALFIRAQAYLASGNLEQASKDFAETIRINTENVVKNPSFTWGYALRGHAHAAQGHTAEAIADYKMMLELDPSHRDSDIMREYILKNST